MKRIFSLFASALLAISAWAVELQVSYDYVNLGLSVKWATCNLGATSSTDAGWYLAWGETSPKTNYTWRTYLSNLDGTMTGWSDAGTDKDPLKDYVYGGSHSEGIGATAYDAATAALGTGYRMPTQTEFEELANTDNCEWVWYDKGNDEFNGVAGYKVTSKKEGYTDKYIFLPAAGYREGEDPSGEGSDGFYWSSTPVTSSYANFAFHLYFYSDDVYPYNTDMRCNGSSVRPVYDGPDPIAQITTDKGTTGYTDVDKLLIAYGEIDDEATVTLLRNITLSDGKEFNNTNSDAYIVFDLNGHNITNTSDYRATFRLRYSKLRIAGEGVVEVTGESSSVFVSNGSTVVNGGTYKSPCICFVFEGSDFIINGGKFKTAAVCDDDDDFGIRPIVKGGIFSMDPSDCVAEGYVSVANDDEDTKAEYPYKVVEKSLTPTAIDAVNAEKSGKAIKTLKNGRVVIIRDNKNFDLSGREL